MCVWVGVELWFLKNLERHNKNVRFPLLQARGVLVIFNNQEGPNTSQFRKNFSYTSVYARTRHGVPTKSPSSQDVESWHSPWQTPYGDYKSQVRLTRVGGSNEQCFSGSFPVTLGDTQAQHREVHIPRPACGRRPGKTRPG